MVLGRKKIKETNDAANDASRLTSSHRKIQLQQKSGMTEVFNSASQFGNANKLARLEKKILDGRSIEKLVQFFRTT